MHFVIQNPPTAPITRARHLPLSYAGYERIDVRLRCFLSGAACASR